MGFIKNTIQLQSNLRHFELKKKPINSVETEQEKLKKKKISPSEFKYCNILIIFPDKLN